ncbi:hypothetical protein L6452_41887 [Arctium lappa]|uniref:Uncharacterized protein n=1 Tax=Arctium lappa TaxID=4217 RepID=A0ACB8XH83_ARCLA|nr:hypothetical protein L6452_41887 [Arctium lappa]
MLFCQLSNFLFDCLINIILWGHISAGRWVFDGAINCILFVYLKERKEGDPTPGVSKATATPHNVIELLIVSNKLCIYCLPLDVPDGMVLVHVVSIRLG